MTGSFPAEIKLILEVLGIFGIGFALAVIGNSIIDRVPHYQSVTHPGPYCKSCAVKFLWKDMIPIWSYVTSGGKCPYCGSAISVRSIMVDIATLGWVSVFIIKFGWSYQAFLEILFGMGLIVVMTITQESKRISDLILLLMGMLSMIYVLTFQPSDFPQATLSFILGSGILLFYNLLKRSLTIPPMLMDFSEVKFGAILGLFLGFPEILLCFLLAVFAGAFIGTVQTGFLTRDNPRAVPAFPILMAGAGVVTILFGREMLDFYRLLLF